MITIKSFTFNPFQENTYVLSDSSKKCLIIDPGCYNSNERDELTSYIKSNRLTPVKLLNTHCHIDHIMGNKFIHETYKVDLEIHKDDLDLLQGLTRIADLYGIPNVEESPLPTSFLNEGDKIALGDSELDILFIPGHSPGHVVFISHSQKFVIGGDVLFYGSIGRTDLPGGDHQTLIDGIKKKLFALPDDFKVYTGHGPETTIGYEKKTNPFLQ